MKSSRNSGEIRRKEGRRLFSLATLITVAIILLVVVSVLAIAGVLFHNLNINLAREFEERIRAEGNEIGQALTNRIDAAQGRLKNLTLDNTVRVTLMLETSQQLDEYLAKGYAEEPDLHFFVTDPEREKVFVAGGEPFSPAEIAHVLAAPAHGGNLENTIARLGFSYCATAPVKRRLETIGTGAVVYQPGRDRYLQQIMAGREGNRLVLVRDGKIWDLLAGTILAEAGTVPAPSSAGIRRLKIDGRSYEAVRRDEFPELYYLADLNRLESARRQVLFSLLLPSAIVIGLAVFVSILISRRISRPLQQLSRLALAIAARGRDRTDSVSTTRIIEFERFRSSLATMVDRLEQAREMERYQELFDNVADIVIIQDLDGRIIDANQVAERQLASAGQSLAGRRLIDLVPAGAAGSLQQELDKLHHGPEKSIFSTEIADAGGNALAVECHTRRIVYNNQEVFLNVLRDINDRMAAENLLKESQRILTTVLDSIQATILVCDVASHEILFMNRQTIETYGENTDNRKCYQFIKNSDKPCKNCPIPGLLADRQALTPGREAYNAVVDKWFMSYDRLIDWIDGRQAKLQISFDISEMKKLEAQREQARAQLRKAQKMEAIATLAGGVAHDLNNILTGIVSFPDLLLLQVKKDDPMYRPLAIIRDAGLRASAIVQDLLTLARRGVLVNEVVNLNEIVLAYLDSPEHQRLMGEHEGVDIVLDLQDELFNIIGSPLHLSKTIMNLAANGVEAIDKHGTLAIATFAEMVGPDKAATLDMKSGEYVVLRIEDNGCGIEEQARSRIFEPFFTTKVMGKSGTGLGMAVVWGTVEDHEGFIDLQSEVGRGTVFTLYFPLTRKKLLKEQMVFSRGTFKGNGETILVVDDVAELRDIASLMFTQLGYQVATAASGEEAVAYLSAHRADLVLLDMIMVGGMNGLETYRRILELHPGQKAIITTGYSEIQIVQEARALGAGQYIKKPYLFEEIAKAVWTELHKATPN